MAIAVSRNAIPRRVADERWIHIVEAHGYRAGNLERVIETLEDPDEVVAGSKGELIALRHYETTVVMDSRMEGDLIYHYRGEELVGVTILHAKGACCQPGK